MVWNVSVRSFSAIAWAPVATSVLLKLIMPAPGSCMCCRRDWYTVLPRAGELIYVRRELRRHRVVPCRICCSKIRWKLCQSPYNHPCLVSLPINNRFFNSGKRNKQHTDETKARERALIKQRYSLEGMHRREREKNEHRWYLFKIISFLEKICFTFVMKWFAIYE